jgi:chemotaxis protein methyltransferase CheR
VSFDPGEGALERFRALVAARLGLQHDESKLGFLAEVLRRRAELAGASVGSYLQRLEAADGAREELRALVPELTVTETYFFRHRDQLRAFAELVVPERLQAAARRPLRVLSAGCASGEEPYTLAMLLLEQLGPAAAGTVAIRAVDVNATMLERAGRARYGPWSLRETPADAQRRWFEHASRDLVVRGEVRALVELQEANLAGDDPVLWRAASYDVVFCRNVLMYFTPEQAQAAVARVARALVPGGYLFLGHAETLRGLSQDFHLRHTHEAFYYQRRGAGEAACPPEPSAALGAPLAAALEGADSWVDAIRRATDRIEDLAGGAPAVRAPAPAVAGRDLNRSGASWDLRHALELLRQERFDEALVRVGDLPADAARDPDVLLLRAALLAHRGALDDAEQVCRELLARDEMSAGAHYILALCREGAGDRAGARHHDQVAAYLDPAFAMPRLHLGLMARRAGEVDAARGELGQALSLLQAEEAARIILFGGGFGREALLALCRGELAALEARRGR